jgi:phosphoribosylformylglycinamidine synthase
MAVDVPYVSGNVSLYNETSDGAIPPTPVLMGVGLVEDIRNCTTSDMKKDGSIWLIGKTKEEMGASLYYRSIGKDCPNIPKTDFDSFIPRMEQLIQAIEQGEVVACHDISTGGIATAVIEMCMSGVGANIGLGEDMRADVELFSESNGRWIVQVAKGKEKGFARRFDYASRIGEVGNKVAFSKGNDVIVELEIDELRNAWTRPVWDRLA